MIDLPSLVSLAGELARVEKTRSRSDQRHIERSELCDLFFALTNNQSSDGLASSLWLDAATLDDTALPLGLLCLRLCDREPQFSAALRKSVGTFELKIGGLARRLTATLDNDLVAQQPTAAELLVRSLSALLDVPIASQRTLQRLGTQRAETAAVSTNRLSRLQALLMPSIELAERYDQRRAFVLSELRETLTRGKPIPSEEDLRRLIR